MSINNLKQANKHRVKKLAVKSERILSARALKID